MRAFALALIAFSLIGGVIASAQTPTATGTKDDPIPFKQTATVGDSWKIRVLQVFADPSKIDPKATWFTDWLKANPAAEGEQYFTVRVRITNISKQSAEPASALSMALVSDSGFEYDGRSSCGQVPGTTSFMEQLDAGDAIDANYCWRVREEHIDSLLLRLSPAMSFEEREQVWLAIREQPGTPTPES